MFSIYLIKIFVLHRCVLVRCTKISLLHLVDSLYDKTIINAVQYLAYMLVNNIGVRIYTYYYWYVQCPICG